MWRKLGMSLARFRSDIRGVAAVEFALVAPVMTLLMMGTIDLGFAMKERADLFNAAHAGAQKALYTNDVATISNAVLIATNAPTTGAGALSVSVMHQCSCTDYPTLSSDNCGAGSGCSGTGAGFKRYAYVTVSRAYETMLRYPGIDSPIQLNETAIIQTEQK